MYEIISQEKFRELLNGHIDKDIENTLYALDVIYPALENRTTDKLQSYVNGTGGVVQTLVMLTMNLDLLTKDELTKENDDMVYFINDEKLPAKMTRQEYEKMLKGESVNYDEEEYETGYLQMPTDKDETMFG